MRYFNKFLFLCTWLPPSALGVIAGSAGAKELSYSSFLQLLWISHSHYWMPCEHFSVSTKWSSTWLTSRPQDFPSTSSFPQLKIKQKRSSVPMPSQNPSRDRSLLFLSYCPLCAVTKTSRRAISRHRNDTAFLLSELRATWCWSPARLHGHWALSRCWSTAQLLRHLCLFPILVSLLFYRGYHWFHPVMAPKHKQI